MEEVSSSIRKKLQATIPFDIIIEFLLRLRVKTLLRFKVVCKTWYNFIKSHTFQMMHHNFCKVSHLLLHKRIRKERNPVFSPGFSSRVFSFRSNDKLMSESSPDLKIHADPNRIVSVVGSCNGIVCYDCHEFNNCGSSTIFLCNPATREFKQLPPTSLQLGVTDSWSQHHAVAFGFESSNIYDFKVVRVFCAVGSHKDEIRAEMFTLSSNTWRELDWSLNNKLVLLYWKGLFCANSFHFIMRYRQHSYAEDAIHNNDTIICCDICSERFKTMNFPLKPNEDRGYFEVLMTFNGCLSSTFFNCYEKPIEIWVMKDYGVAESWTKLYTIGPCMLVPLCFYMDEDDLLLVQLKTQKLVSCHLNAHTLDVGSIEICWYQLDDEIIVYKETLASCLNVTI